MTNQSRTAIVGVVRGVLLIALFVFVPAWSLDYWEAWLYLLFLSISLTLLKWYLLKWDPALAERRKHTGPKFEAERSQQIIQSFGGALICGIFVASGLEHRVHGSVVSPATVFAADAFLLVGFYIVFRTFRENSFAASTVRTEAEQPVISSGPYGWVRHPMYFGCVIGFLATPIALGSLWGLVPAVLKCGTLVVRLLYEEDYLARNLAGYQAYRARVRCRLIPLVW
jgi:protein-S-isoprenylcysteine O-methyltransferase Ste14